MTTREASTPLMQQYREIKARHQDAILFFRMGDFYEMFYEDAEVASRVLGLTLTARHNGGASDVPLAVRARRVAARRLDDNAVDPQREAAFSRRRVERDHAHG